MLTAEQIVDILTDTCEQGVERDAQIIIDNRRLALQRKYARFSPRDLRQARIEWLEAQMKEWGKG